jgi:acetylornithine aminotransferase
MSLFDVYNQWNIKLTEAEGANLWDHTGKEYLDFYGGHGVISIGHNHTHWKSALKNQLDAISFYSNAVINPLQEKLAKKLAKLSGYSDYELFMCNSGAEANENAIKLASFHTQKEKIIAFKGAFHGRTSGAVMLTDNPLIQAPFNQTDNVIMLPLNDAETLESALKENNVAAIIIEGIQGVGGLDEPSPDFLNKAIALCEEYSALLIMDEVQSGFGRSGDFFAHQHITSKADIICMAKGMGNGFPVAGILISPKIKAKKGMLGTTFGGNHLACAACIAVLDIIEKESLLDNAKSLGEYIRCSLSDQKEIKQFKGRGLMLGVEFGFPMKAIQKELLENGIFTGGSSNPNLLRILPPLNITKNEADQFIDALKHALKKITLNETVH